MDFRDDQAWSTPVPGGNSGPFAEGDIVGASPTTSERVVDTQSGFLVVIKQVQNTRLALSVKRRLGTPPSSFVLLTPDESVKLSKILAEARAPQSTPSGRLSPRADRFRNTLSSKSREEIDELTLPENAPEKEFARVAAEKLGEGEFRRRRPAAERIPLKWSRVAIVVGALLTIPLLAVLILRPAHQTAPAVTAATSAKPPVDVRIDKFVREYVADMLDFNPATYKSSQIRAMAAMKPELLERYWKETNFPLTSAQLKNTPKGQTIIITKIAQLPIGTNLTNVDLFAELVGTNNKISAPLHLQLKIDSGAEELRLIDQNDLSSSK